jgi:hypothetical protein
MDLEGKFNQAYMEKKNSFLLFPKEVVAHFKLKKKLIQDNLIPPLSLI